LAFYHAIRWRLTFSEVFFFFPGAALRKSIAFDRAIALGLRNL